LEELEAEIEKDCDWLRGFLFAAQVRHILVMCYDTEVMPLAQIINEISPRSKDSIVGLGEKLSCKIVTAVLRDRVSVYIRYCVGSGFPLMLTIGH
jgi:aspartate kinase